MNLVMRGPHHINKQKKIIAKIFVFFISSALILSPSAAISVQAQTTQQQQVPNEQQRAAMLNQIASQMQLNPQEQAAFANLNEQQKIQFLTQKQQMMLAQQNYSGQAGAGTSSSAALPFNAAGVFTCLGGDAIAKSIAGTLSNLLGDLTNSASNVMKVPVADSVVQGNVQLQTNKDVATGFRFDFMGISGSINLPSLDSAAYCLVNSIIDHLTQSTVNWINSGFQGSPVFVQDPELFFRDVADREAGAFLGKLSNGFLCSPFQLQIRLALLNSQLNQYGPGGYGACTLSSIVQNSQSFLNGNFSQGGWIGWNALTQQPGNNPYGSYLQASQALQTQVSAGVNTAQITLDWGKGFLSFKDDKGNIKTPGAVIEDQINNRLGASQDRIEMADEFDEIVTALFNQLVKTALSEVLGPQSY